MVIAVDVDNVLNDMIETTLKIYNKKTNSQYEINDITTYHLSECFPPDVAQRMKEIWLVPGFWFKTKPRVGARDGLEKLMREGHQMYLVTANEFSTMTEKVEWIKHYFPFIDDEHIVCMRHKWLFKADIMIDDSIENLLGGCLYYRVCMDAPWNRDVRDEIYSINRANNWNDIIDIVNHINDLE